MYSSWRAVRQLERLRQLFVFLFYGTMYPSSFGQLQRLHIARIQDVSCLSNLNGRHHLATKQQLEGRLPRGITWH